MGVLLLRDLPEVFGDAERLPTKTILEWLNALEESPWSDIRGKELDARSLPPARQLSFPTNGAVTAVTTQQDVECPHGMVGGDQPDAVADGDLTCPQCRLEAS